MTIRLLCPDCRATFQVDRVTFETCPGCDAKLRVEAPPRSGIDLLIWTIPSTFARAEPTRSEYLQAAAIQGILALALGLVAAAFLANRTAWAAVPGSVYLTLIPGVAAGVLCLRSAALWLYLSLRAPSAPPAPTPPSPPKDLDLILPDDP